MINFSKLLVNYIDCNSLTRVWPDVRHVGEVLDSDGLAILQSLSARNATSATLVPFLKQILQSSIPLEFSTKRPCTVDHRKLHYLSYLRDVQISSSYELPLSRMEATLGFLDRRANECPRGRTRR